jgi:hypothetical protein
MQNPFNGEAVNCEIPKNKCSLAMAFVPWQNWERLYNEERAFDTGTVFPSLDFKFCGEGIEK